MRVGLLLVWFLLVLQGFSQTPTTPSSNLTFSDTYCDRTNLTFTRGNGTARIVVFSESSALTNLPQNNNFYLANDTFGNGHSFGTGQYVVYNGSGSSVFVRNLKKNTTYYVSVFEYNGSGTVFNYLTNNYPEAQVTTEWITASFTIDDPYQCENVDSFNFTSSVTQSGSATINYAWRFGDGNTSTAQNPSHVYDTFGIFDVQLTASSIGCQHTVSVKDTVAPLPTVDFILDPDSAFNTSEQCFFEASGRQNRFAWRNLSTLANIPGNNASVVWDYGDGGTSNNFRGRRIYSEPGTYEVKLILKASINQGRDQCIDSASMIINVKPNPVDSARVLFSDSIQCLNGNEFFFDHLTSDFTTTNTWFFGDGASEVGRNVSHSYAASGRYPVRLEVIDSAGCYGDYTDTVEVIPQPNNSFTGLDSNYCEGDPPATLTPSLDGGTFEGDNVNNTDNTFTPNLVGRNTIQHIIQIGGCRDTFTAQTTVNPIPIFEIGGDTSICVGSSYTKSIVRDGAAILWSTGSTDSFTTINGGQVVWAQRTQAGCSFRDSFRVEEIAAPQVELGRDSLLCGDGSITVDVSAPEATYMWNDNYVGPQRTFTSSGFYKVTVTNKCGTASDSFTLEFLPYACEIFIPNAFSPNGDNLNDVFKPSGTVDLISLEIYNRWGEMLHQQEGAELSWDGNANGERVQQGHYYYVLRYFIPEEGKQLKKLATGSVYVLY
jgi:gliding motility-associated-like protein